MHNTSNQSTQTGTITHWNGKKGYGFIRPDDGGSDVFFHITKWESEQRPRKEKRVHFHAQTEANGKINATWVGYDASSGTVTTTLPQASKWRVKKIATLALGMLLMVSSAFFANNQFNNGFETDHEAHNQSATTQTVLAHQDDQTSRQTSRAQQGILNDRDVRRTLALIQSNGPFPYDRDGIVFYNREGLLPKKARGYYHEYTVPTPGVNTRGARRIVTGGTPPDAYYYTADHYKSFEQLTVN